MTLLTNLSLRRPLTVYVLMLLVFFGGLSTYLSLPRESFPEIKIPLIIVSAVYPGTAPADMESQITRKIELEIKGISGIKEIRSSSFDGFCMIEVEFNPDVDLDTALQKVREGVDRAKPDLPDDLDDPSITDIDFSRTPIMVVTLAGEFGIERLKEIADDLKDDLEAIPGVNLINVVGGRDREVQVYADPRRLTAYKLGLSDLVETIAREHLTVPGGDIDIGRLNFLVRVPAEVEDPLDIGEFVVDASRGRVIHIRDVATVQYGFEEETTRSRLNRHRAISLTVEKRTGANIIEVADLVRERVERLRRHLPSTAQVKVVADMSTDIRSMVRELENNVLSGLLLVLVVLFLAMGWRPAVIVAAAIPFSMLISFIVLALLGYTLNMVVLFSMVLVLGMLVDNAVVTVENIYRHRELGDDTLTSSRLGTGEVAMPIIASTATTLCAFAPMIFWPGIIGEFMKYLPVTLIIGLTASLFVALVFNPALALKLLERRPRRRTAGASDSGAPPDELRYKGRGRFMAAYRRVLEIVLDPGEPAPRHFLFNWLLLTVFFVGLGTSAVLLLGAMLLEIALPPMLLMVPALIGGAAFTLQALLWLPSMAFQLWGRRVLMTDNRARVLYSMGMLLVLTVWAYSAWNHGVELFPDPQPRAVWVDFEFPSGTNLEAQDELVAQVEAMTADTPDLEDMVTNVGSRGIAMEPSAGGGASNVSRVSLNLLEYRKRKRNSNETLEQVRRLVSRLSGARIRVDKPVEGPPTGKPVAIRLIGEDYGELARYADRLRDELETIPGLYNVDHDFDAGYPELRVHVNREEAARAKTNTADIALAIRTALAGTEVAKYRTGEDEYEITVRLPPDERRSEEPLEELTILDDDGQPIPLRSLATIETTAGPAAIRRVDLKRVITVEADVDHAGNFKDADMRHAARAKLERMDLPPQIRWEFAGSNQEEEDARSFLSRAFVVALLLIALILVTEFDSLVTPLTILVSVILSLIGVLWGLIITRTPFGIIMTGIGVISLAGIVVNNAIVLCDFILQQRGKGVPRREAIISAGMTRLRPVLLTAITTILGLIPLTTGLNFDFFSFEFVIGGESSEWWGPMGIAVIFGLAAATVLTLVVVPVTYDVLASATERLGRSRSSS